MSRSGIARSDHSPRAENEGTIKTKDALFVVVDKLLAAVGGRLVLPLVGVYSQDAALVDQRARWSRATWDRSVRVIVVNVGACSCAGRPERVRARACAAVDWRVVDVIVVAVVMTMRVLVDRRLVDVRMGVLLGDV